ncbi:MAG: hypothetical protein VB141_08800 [Burkholderia gladioli]
MDYGAWRTSDRGGKRGATADGGGRSCAGRRLGARLQPQAHAQRLQHVGRRRLQLHGAEHLAQGLVDLHGAERVEFDARHGAVPGDPGEHQHVDRRGLGGGFRAGGQCLLQAIGLAIFPAQRDRETLPRVLRVLGPRSGRSARLQLRPSRPRHQAGAHQQHGRQKRAPGLAKPAWLIVG